MEESWLLLNLRTIQIIFRNILKSIRLRDQSTLIGWPNLSLGTRKQALMQFEEAQCYSITLCQNTSFQRPIHREHQIIKIQAKMYKFIPQAKQSSSLIMSLLKLHKKKTNRHLFDMSKSTFTWGVIPYPSRLVRWRCSLDLDDNRNWVKE